MTSPPSSIEIFLQPGELWFGDESTRIRTILGSCVAVTLWHPGRRIGGMCHYMLPARSRRTKDALPDGRYGDEALELLLKEIRAKRAHPAEFEAKLFGGGYMFTGSYHSDRSCASQVQHRNITTGRELMARHGFKIKAEHLGGHGHRQVIFDIHTGHVWMKHTPLPIPSGGAASTEKVPTRLIHPLIEKTT